MKTIKYKYFVYGLTGSLYRHPIGTSIWEFFPNNDKHGWLQFEPWHTEEMKQITRDEAKIRYPAAFAKN